MTEINPGVSVGARVDINTDARLLTVWDEGEGWMRTVAFYNNKGGVGKTTLAVHVALRAALHHGLRTVAMGLDRQGDLLRWLSGGTFRSVTARSTSTAAT